MSETFYFDEEQFQAFIELLRENFIFEIIDEMGGGYSGARTLLVYLEPIHSDKVHIKRGNYILKVCRSEEADKEEQKHVEAKASPSLGEHIPDLIESIHYKSIPLTGILYRIAGESRLEQTTLQKALESHFPMRHINELADVILQWNFERKTTSEISSMHTVRTSNLLECILNGLGENRMKELEERLVGNGEHFNRSRIDVIPLNTPLYNPIYLYNPIHFLHNQEIYKALERMKYVIPKGQLHGDLHPGNVIIPKKDNLKGSFHIIDFASSRVGNAFFDLAYLEISMLFNCPGLTDLKIWWELEKYIHTKYLPSDETFTGKNIEGLRRILPIRRALDERIKLDGKDFEDDYWIAFLAASIEAGLDLARKVYRDRSLQQLAFLTAAARFDYLVELLEVIQTYSRGPMATIYWTGEELLYVQGGKQKEEHTLISSISSFIQEEMTTIELVWPGEITQRAALYDPWKIIGGIQDKLTGENNQGVLLIGERVFGKSSFFNCAIGLFPKEEGDLRSIRLDTWENRYSVRSFATELLRKMSQSVGLTGSSGFESTIKDFNVDNFLLACQVVADKKKGMRFVICIDEIDSTIAKARSKEDARTILQLLFRLLTDPHLPVRLLFTTNSKEVLGSYRSGINLMRKLVTWRIPLCSESEMRGLIERFEVPITFEGDALSRIFHYSGGQIYFVKFAVSLLEEVSKVQDNGKNGKKIISVQSVDNLMHEVITPTSSTPFAIRNIHDEVFDTMKNIFSPLFFSKEEQQFMQSLTEAHGTLRASDLPVNRMHLANIAEDLHERGYISKNGNKGDEEYSWRIGIWQLFLEDYYQLEYRRNRR
jgi:energy-coupling factor transporter ATP-binding protein EcfA2